MKDRLFEILSKKLADFGAWVLRLLDPELSHHIGMKILRMRVLDYMAPPKTPKFDVSLKVRVPGIGTLRHPVCLAAGFDKNAEALAGLASIGFSMMEIGTITPQPQEGNPKPRLFRYKHNYSLINRMGFNSHGSQQVLKRLQVERWNYDQLPIGINIGKNKVTPEHKALFDYVQQINTFKDHGNYFVINLSSPNTPGLRDLATPEFLHQLANEVDGSLSKIWIKLDPDRGRESFQNLVNAISEYGFQGVIVSNTHGVTWPEVGGQSGHPILSMSNTCLEWAWEVHSGKLPMIASGGVLSGRDILEKMRRGASAVQIYTALVYQGPWVVANLLNEFHAELKALGVSHVEEIIGTHYR